MQKQTGGARPRGVPSTCIFIYRGSTSNLGFFSYLLAIFAIMRMMHPCKCVYLHTTLRP